MEKHISESVPYPVIERLVRMAEAGNEQAFEQIVKLYESAVYNMALYMTKNREDALDVSQEVFIKLWRSLGSFRGDCSIKSYIMKLTKNASLDLLRRRSRTDNLSLTAENEKGDEVQLDVPDTADESNPEAAYLKKERIRKVREGLMKLDDDQREIIVLRDMEGMSYTDIAHALKISEGTVKSRLHRARSALKKILTEGNYF